MNNNSSYNKVYTDLSYFGLKEGEIKVYLAAFELGAATKQELTDKLKMSRTTVNNYLTTLIQKRFVVEIKKKTRFLIQANPPSYLKKIVDSKKWELDNIIQNLDITIENIFKLMPKQDVKKLYYDEERLKEEFLECLKNRVLEEKFRYIGQKQAQAWVDNCHSQQYMYYKKSLAFIKKIKDDIAKEIKTDCNIISLGPGDGVKDLEIAMAVKEKVDISYNLVDLSKDLLEIATENAQNKYLQPEIFISDIVKNLLYISDHVRKRNYANHIFILLGNTFGNYHQAAILGMIRQSMKVGDYFFVGVDLNNDSPKTKGYDSQIYKKHMFAPFYNTSIQMEDGEIEMKGEVDELFPSIFTVKQYFKFVKNVTIEYNNEEVFFGKGEKMLISYSHKYNITSLGDLITAHGFKIVKTYQDETNNYVKLLCQLA